MVGSLGRLLQHDERSREFPARTAAALKSVRHRHYGPVLDQGSLGSCTGNAIAQALNTVPLKAPRRVLTETDAVALYSRATVIDGVAGTYPPDDTGSSGLAVCKAAQEKGLIGGYTHAFGLDHALGALMLGPVIAGVNWYEGFDTPARDGLCKISGQVRGGHEICLVGLDVKRKRVRAINSWGESWGDGGFFEWSFDTFGQLLDENGDVTAPRM